MLTFSSAFAEPVSGIRSLNVQPIAPRGGVLMLPLTADRPGDNWPATVDLQTSAKHIITGQVAWIETAPESFDRQWTEDLRGLRLRAVQPTDDSSTLPPQSTLGPYLLARLPEDGAGQLLLGKQKIDPRWHDLPAAVSSDDLATLELAPGPDRPDPISPFEYWRWVLLAERLEMSPPSPWEGNGELAMLAAEHYAALWRIGLNRLAARSERIAGQCRDALTQMCIDRRQPFAAWAADPLQVRELLTRLLDFNRDETLLLSDVVEWIDAQPLILFWPEHEFGDEVRLSIVTPGADPVLVNFQWLESGEPPLTSRLEPGVLTQVTIVRPPLPKPIAVGLPAPPEPSRQVLQIEAGHQKFELAFGPRVVRAKPPGVFFRPFPPPLTLAEVQLRQQRVIGDEQATFAQVRRLGGRWEVFFECRRNPIENPPTSQMTQIDNEQSASSVDVPSRDLHNLPEHMTSYEDLRGVEAITLLLGSQVQRGMPDSELRAADPRGPQLSLTIPETGFWRLAQATTPNDGTLQIHRRSLNNRWYCRVVLPEAWFSAAETSPALIGFIRSHGDSQQLETGPNPSTPWRPNPSRAAIDLQYWDDLPRE